VSARAARVFGEVTASHPLAFGLVVWPDSRATIIVKTTLIAAAASGFEPLQDDSKLEPLRLDTFDSGGRIVAGTDFAPYKPRCDVVVLGEGAPERSEPGRLVAGPIDARVAPSESLDPLPSTMADGDPDRASRSWSSGEVDFLDFQAAPPARRMPWPQGDFEVSYSRGSPRLMGRCPGFVLRASLVSLDGGRALPNAAMALDTVALMPRKRQLTLTFRGVLEARFDLREARLEISLVDRWGAPRPDARWRAQSTDTPAEARTRLPARRTAESFAVTTTAVARPSPATMQGRGVHGLGTSLPFANVAPDPAAARAMDPTAFAALRSTSSEATPEPPDLGASTVALTVSPAFALAPASPNPRPPSLLGRSLRLSLPSTVASPATIATPASVAGPDGPVEDEDLGASTVTLTVPEELRSPRVVSAGVPSPPLPRVLPALSTTTLEPPRQPLLPQAWVPPPATMTAVPNVPAGGIDQCMRVCASVRASLWRGIPLADVLDEHGLDEASYRLEEGRIMAALQHDIGEGRLATSEQWLRLLDDAGRAKYDTVRS